MKKRSKIILIISLLISLLTVMAGTAYAAGPPPAGSGLQVTGFTVVEPASGNITRNTPVTIEVSFFDDRVKDTSVPAGTNVTATGVVNTSSFSGSNGTATFAPGTNGSSFTMTFYLTYTGTGNSFSCYITYANANNGAALTVPITSISPVTISRLVEYVPPAPEEPASPPTPVPTDFILRDASYGSDTIYAGVPFTLTAVILATSGSSPVDNVSVSFTPPEQMTFVDGSSVVYIGRMQPGATAKVSANLMPNGNITQGSYTVNIIAEGFNSDGGRISSPMSVSIPVLQPERFEIFNTTLPTFLNAGMDDGTGFGSVTLVNKGQGAVSNVTVDVIGDGLYFSEGRQFIGNINGGAQSVADFMLRADIPGRIAALLVVTYENVRGEQKTLEYPFDIEVAEFMPPEFVDPGFPPVEEVPAGTGIPTWGWILIIAGAAIAATVILVQMRKKKLAAAEAALDDDEDDDD
jgi:hypothetical protein